MSCHALYCRPRNAETRSRDPKRPSSHFRILGVGVRTGTVVHVRLVPHLPAEQVGLVLELVHGGEHEGLDQRPQFEVVQAGPPAIEVVDRAAGKRARLPVQPHLSELVPLGPRGNGPQLQVEGNVQSVLRRQVDQPLQLVPGVRALAALHVGPRHPDVDVVEAQPGDVGEVGLPFLRGWSGRAVVLDAQREACRFDLRTGHE